MRRTGHAFMCECFLVQVGVTELALAEGRKKCPLELYTQVCWAGPGVAGQLPCTRGAGRNTALAVKHGVWMEFQNMH